MHFREFGLLDFDANYYGHEGPSVSSNYYKPYNEPGLARSIRFSLWAAHAYSELRSRLPKNDLKVLDIGGATGLFAQYLQKFPGVEMFVSDFSTWATQNTVPALKGNSVQADVRLLPYKDGSFQGITCFDVLEHIPEQNVQRGIHEMHRVLQKGGRSVVVVNIGSPDFDNDRSHVTRKDIAWWKKQFRETGFQVSKSVFEPLTMLPGKDSVLRKKLTVFNPGLIIADKA